METAVSSLQAVLDDARIAYTRRNPRSRDMSRAAATVLPGGNTRSVLYHGPFPLYFERGENEVVWDVDGHRYVNLLGEYTAGLFGHTHPVIREAILQALERGVNLSGHTEGERRLAEQIRQRFPSMELMRFTNSGTEANLMAIQAARLATGRSRVMVFSGGYHGGVLAFAGGGSPVNAPFPYVVGRYNDVAALRELVHTYGEDLACVLVEPMIGSGGCIPADSEFLRAIRDETSRCGAICIFDEVMTSRLSIGGAQWLHGIKPDMTTLGKYIGGGMSFGAFGGARGLMERFDPARADAVAHAGTFNNNVLTMAAGAAALERVLTEEAIQGLNRRGDHLRQALNTLFSEERVAIQVTGQGSLMNIHARQGEIRCPEDAAAGDDRVKELLFLDMLEAGFYMARRGFVALTLAVSDADIEEFLGAVRSFVSRRRALLAPV